jgi:hypothetical protein
LGCFGYAPSPKFEGAGWTESLLTLGVETEPLPMREATQISDHTGDVDLAALLALLKAGAIKTCAIHRGVTIRVGDNDAERQAYDFATTIRKNNGTMWGREALIPAIINQLGMAADRKCPSCAGASLLSRSRRR